MLRSKQVRWPAVDSDDRRRAAAAAGVKPARQAPGPRLPGPLQSWLIFGRPFETRLAFRERYGPVFRVNEPVAGEFFHVADRESLEQVLKWKPHQYEVFEPKRILLPVLGSSSLLLLDGSSHIRMRRLLLPPFHGEAIANYASVIEEVTHREIDEWSPGDRIRTRSVALAITLEVLIRTVFGVTDEQRIAELKRLLPRLCSINPLALFVQKDLGPLSPWGRFLRQRDRIDEILYAEIRERRTRDREPGAVKDVLTLLLSATDEDGGPLSDEELRDQMITLLLAGHDTTSASIAWAFERLLRTPAALGRLTAEVRAGEGSEYLNAVIKETLRIRPVVPEIVRMPTEPGVLGGYLFEPGQQLAVSIMLVHFDPDVYGPDAQTFRPERFLDGGPEPYSWLPYGSGVRRCIGAAFADLEMRVVIRTILSRAELGATRDADEKARFRGVFVHPGRGGEALVTSMGATKRSD